MGTVTRGASDAGRSHFSDPCRHYAGHLENPHGAAYKPEAGTAPPLSSPPLVLLEILNGQRSFYRECVEGFVRVAGAFCVDVLLLVRV